MAENKEELMSLFGEGNGTPLQYSCLENPMDGGAWWAAVHGIAKSQTLVIKRHLLLGIKVMKNLNSMLKSRDITLHTNVCLVKTIIFPVVLCGCENWTIKKAEHRTDAFKLWYWRRVLRVPWTAKRSNLSILQEINSEYSLERLVLNLKLQYFGHLM